MTDDLIAFLRARLDDDEATAEGASGAEWGDIEPSQPFVVLDVEAYRKRKTQTTVGAVASVARAEDRAHIARHDPARVLREVEAKRRILSEHTVTEPYAFEGKSGTIAYCPVCRNNGECPTLRLLTLPYADHPDYQPEWALPEG